MKILLLDIETAPHRVYCWGLWDQNIAINQIEEPGYTLCWAAKWYGEKRMMFQAVWSQSAGPDMIHTIHALIDQADAVVHYNGTRFDMPTLNQEFLGCDMWPPAPYKQIDLLQTARKQLRLPSNKLDYVAQHFKLGSKFEHKGMSLWRDVMSGDPKAQKIMEKYNKQDVVLLEKVYKKFMPWIKQHPNHGLYVDNLGRPICSNCGSKHVTSKGDRINLITRSYHRWQCMKCGTHIRSRLSIKGQSPELVPVA